MSISQPMRWQEAPAPEHVSASTRGYAGHKWLDLVLVDDHPLVLEGLARAVQRHQMRAVAQVVASAEALLYLDSHNVDLLVVDLRLRGESGLDLVERVHKRQPALPIAVLTSYEDHAAANQAIRAGARGFLLKDALSDELVQRLRGIAEGDLVIDHRVADAVLKPTDITLTAQELRILAMVADGETNREIGAALHMSPYTVKDHLTRSMRKLGTRTRAETVARATREGVLTDFSPTLKTLKSS